MTDRELMQQALDAMLNFPNDISDEMFESIRSLRARLAQPEQEHSEQWWKHEVSNAWAEGYEKGRASVKQPEQEPVWVEVTTNTGDKFILDSAVEADKIRAARDAGLSVVPLYTAPPQREWQGLTDEEKLTIVRETDNPVDALAATEAKLKEKNGTS
jgi:hypothetical protein